MAWLVGLNTLVRKFKDYTKWDKPNLKVLTNEQMKNGRKKIVF